MQTHHVFLIEWGVRVLMALVIIRRKRAPSTALAWLAVVSFVPIFGALAYLLIGENRLGGRRLRAFRALGAVPSPALEAARAAFEADLDPRFRSVARLAEAVGAGSSVAGADLELLSSPEGWRLAAEAAIDGATHHVHMLYFICRDDDTGRAVGHALQRAAARGVKCRLLVDAVGSRGFLRSPLRVDLESGGVKVIEVMPVNPLRAAVARLDLRNHRKLLIVDGAVAITGSHNLADAIDPRKAHLGPWVDASVRLTGPVVDLLQAVFLRDWTFCGGAPAGDDLFAGTLRAPVVPVQTLPTGPDGSGAPLVEVMGQAIAAARRSVTLTTPYFVPDEAILAALRAAALRGIEVTLILPRRSDHRITQAAGRSHYGELLEVGVAIHEYQGGLLHAKTVRIDDTFAIVGSANLDVRSFLLNFEMALLVYDRGFASRLRGLHASYLAASRRLDVARWQRRGPVRTFADNVAKLLTPLL
ncbi:MAG: cardiolipin synthase [Planctomycetota bacterium]